MPRPYKTAQTQTATNAKQAINRASHPQGTCAQRTDRREARRTAAPARGRRPPRLAHQRTMTPADLSGLPKEAIVLGMGSDPEPDHVLAFADTQCSPTDPDTNGPDRRLFSHFLEVKTRVGRILQPQPVVLPRKLLDVPGKLPIATSKRRSAEGIHASSKPPAIVNPASWSASARAASDER